MIRPMENVLVYMGGGGSLHCITPLWDICIGSFKRHYF